MNARDFRGEAHAPAPHGLIRAPLTQADDYTPALARTVAEAWNYEAQRDAGDARWTAAAGHRQGGTQRARVLRAEAAA